MISIVNCNKISVTLYKICVKLSRILIIYDYFFRIKKLIESDFDDKNIKKAKTRNFKWKLLSVDTNFILIHIQDSYNDGNNINE